MANSRYMRKRRARLMEKDPHCHWCGVKVIYYPLKKGETMPNNFATLDHLVSRYYKPRFDPKMKQKTMVLACFKCNMKRCEEDTKAQPIEKLWELAGNGRIRKHEAQKQTQAVR